MSLERDVEKALGILARYLDGHQGEGDQWMVSDAYDLLHRATGNVCFCDDDTEAADVASWLERRPDRD
jgi:hypothetical protein